MAKEMFHMRKKLVNEKRDALKQIPREELVDKIINYPNQKILNRDEEGNKRYFPIGKMAETIKEHDYKMTDKQYYTLLHQFTAITVPEMKVAGVSFRENDPTEFKKKLVAEKGSMSKYDIDYILQPEPENEYDPNAVRIMIEKEDGALHQIGYVPADFVAAHPITEETTIHGQMTDWSHGKFKNCSYDIAFDIEEIDKKAAVNQVIHDELPFEITTMTISNSNVDGTEKLKVNISEGSKSLLQKTYYEGSSFVTEGAKNPKGYPTKAELLSELIENYKVDKVEEREIKSLPSDVIKDDRKSPPIKNPNPGVIKASLPSDVIKDDVKQSTPDLSISDDDLAFAKEMKSLPSDVIK